MKVLGSVQRGLAFVVSGPAGAGKTTLVEMLTEEFDCVKRSISYTTRDPRSFEKHSMDYHFVTTSKFEEMIQNNEFLEYAKVFDSYYGTSKQEVEAGRKKGRHMILVIDTQGALQLMGTFDATFIFIRPSTIEELKNRMHIRKSEDPANIQKRLSWAEKEIALAPQYDYTIINDDLKTAYEVLRSVVIAEEHKNR